MESTKSDETSGSEAPHRGPGRPAGTKDSPHIRMLRALCKQHKIKKWTLEYLAAESIAQLDAKVRALTDGGLDDTEALRLRGHIEKHTNTLMRILAKRDANTPKPAGDQSKPEKAAEETNPFAGAVAKHLSQT